jgi:hypothetical protein
MACAWKMTLGAILLSTCTLLVASADSNCASQGPAANKNAGEPNTPHSDATNEVVQAAGKVVEGIELEALVGDTWSKATRIEKPLLLYSDNTRDNDRGSLWAWGDKGRPLALIELYQNVNNRTNWVYAICNTSGGKLRAQRLGAPWWAENDSATEFNDIPNAPAVAIEATSRQRQMKQLAQKFTGHQFWDPNNTRYDLRRLETPLRTYRDEAGPLVPKTSPGPFGNTGSAGSHMPNCIWNTKGRNCSAHRAATGPPVRTGPTGSVSLRPHRNPSQGNSPDGLLRTFSVVHPRRLRARIGHFSRRTVASPGNFRYFV